MIHEIISFLIIVVVLLLYTEIQKLFIKRKLNQFEAPKQIPIVGIAGRFLKAKNDEIINVLLGLFDEVKTTPFQAWFGPILGIIGVAEPQDIRTILTSESCLNKPYFYDFFHGKSSLLVTNREKWKPHRRELDKSFNLKTLQSFIPILNDKTRLLLKEIEPHLNNPDDLFRTIYVCMMDMTSRVIFGEELGFQSERGIFYYDKLKMIVNNIMYRVVRLWLKWDWIYSMTLVGRADKFAVKMFDDLFENIHRKRTKEIGLLKSKGIDYLREIREENSMTFFERCLWMEREGVFNHQSFIDQLRLISVAGVDTSAVTVFGTLLFLAMNQNHQEAVVDELRSVFETADCDVTQEHLAKMRYTERVIKETLRLIPAIPFIARKPSTDIRLAKGIVPKNATVLINIMHLHRNSLIWGQNALEFDPDRFLPENIAKRPPFSYIPFSAGQRNCIGARYAMMSTKIALAHLLRRYKFSTNLRFEEIRLKMNLMIEITNENPLRLEERKF